MQKRFTVQEIFKERTTIFGICAIWVILFHVRAQVPAISSNIIIKITRAVLSYGNMAVDVFLLYSSIGLYNSYKNNTLKQFYLHRFTKVFIPYLVIAIIYYAWYHIFFAGDGIGLKYLFDLSTLNYWTDGNSVAVWYVSFICLMYVIYPLLAKLNEDSKGISSIILIIISVLFEFVIYKTKSQFYYNCETAISRLPIFLFGIYLAPRIKKERIISKSEISISFVLTMLIAAIIVCFDSLPKPVVRYLYGLESLFLVVALSFLIYSFKNSMLKPVILLFEKLGTYSFELYIGHIFVYRIMCLTNSWNQFYSVLYYPLLLIVGLINALFIKFVSGNIQKLLQKIICKE